MKGKEILRPILSTVGVVLTLLCTTIFFYKVTTLNQEQYKRYELDYGWNVRINDDVYENVDLNQFIFPKMVKRGDVVCLTNTLPKGIPTDSTIRILNYLTGVEVSVGGNSQYLYGMDLFREHKFIGSGYHFVHLDKNSGGKDIRITFYPAEDGAFSSISSIVVTDSDYIYADFFNRNVLAIFCAVFLFILGNILMVVGFFVQSKDVVYHRLIPIGAFSYLIGLWSMCDSKFMELYSFNFEFNSILEYVTLYAALIPIMCLIIEIRRETLLKEKWKYRVMAGLTGVNLLFLLVTSILHFTNVVHYSAFISVFHGIAILCVITILLLGAKPIRDMEKDEKVLNIALLEILLFGIVDMVRFNLQVYVFPQVDILNVSILPLGTLIFIIILLVSYLVFIYSRVFGIKDMITSLANGHLILRGNVRVGERRFGVCTATAASSNIEHTLLDITTGTTGTPCFKRHGNSRAGDGDGLVRSHQIGGRIRSRLCGKSTGTEEKTANRRHSNSLKYIFLHFNYYFLKLQLFITQ